MTYIILNEVIYQIHILKKSVYYVTLAINYIKKNDIKNAIFILLNFNFFYESHQAFR